MFFLWSLTLSSIGVVRIGHWCSFLACVLETRPNVWKYNTYAGCMHWENITALLKFQISLVFPFSPSLLVYVSVKRWFVLAPNKYIRLQILWPCLFFPHIFIWFIGLLFAGAIFAWFLFTLYVFSIFICHSLATFQFFPEMLFLLNVAVWLPLYQVSSFLFPLSLVDHG